MDSLNQQILPSFRETMNDIETRSLAVDIADITIDNVFELETLDGLPIARTIAGFCHVGACVRDRYFMKKTLSFLQGFENGAVSDCEKEAYRYKMGNEVFADEELERVITILDSVTEINQAQWLGLCYRRLLDGGISLDDYRELSEAIRRIFIGDAKSLRMIALGEISRSDQAEKRILARLESIGFIDQEFGMTVGDLDLAIKFVKLTKLGDEFFEICLKR